MSDELVQHGGDSAEDATEGCIVGQGTPKIILDESKELCLLSPKRMVGNCHVTSDFGCEMDQDFF